MPSNNNPTVFASIPNQVATEDIQFGMNIKDNFKDPDGDTLTFTLDPLTPLPAGLTLNSSTGVIDGIPTNPAVRNHTITVTASDSSSGSVSNTFVIAVDNTNDAPTVAIPIPNSMAQEDFAFTLDTKPNFGDIDVGDTLTFSATGLPEGLAIASTGVISGTAPNAAVGTKNVTVTAKDSQGASVSSTFVITVEDTNDAPTVTTPIGDRTISEDTPFSISIRNNFTDIDVGNSLTFTATGLPTGLSIAPNGVISGTPTNAAVGNQTIIITANDGNGGTVSSNFILTVTNTNDAPIVVNLIPDTTVEEDKSFSLNITSSFSDIDVGDTLTYTAIGLPEGVSISSAGIISGSPTNNAVGLRNVTVTAKDGKGGSISDTFALTVTNTNDAPTVSIPIPDRTATEDAQFSMNIKGNFADVDGGNTLTFSASVLPIGLTLNSTTGVLNGIPTNANVGTNTITITASDGNGGTVSDDFVLTVSNTNDAPTIATPIPDQTATEDSPFTVNTSSSFADVDTGDKLTFTAASLPAGLVIDPITGVISGTPINAAVGVKNITVTANDNKGGAVSDTFAIAIANTNDVPTVVTPLANQSATEDVFFSMAVKNNFTDVDTVDTLTYFASGLPVGLAIDASTGVISGTATNAAVGANNITITASDGNGGTVNSAFTLTVANTNDAPTLIAPLSPQTATEDSPFMLNISSNFADPDNGDTLTFLATALPDGLTFDNAGTISGSPTNAAVGTKNVTVTANDGKGGTVNGTFALTVINTNDDPNVKMAIGDKTAIEDTPFSLNISGNFADIDLGDSLAFSAAGLPEGVEINPNTGVISGSANNNGVGTHSITVVADDGDGGTASDTFILTITNTNDAPAVVNSIPDRLATEEAAFTFDVSGNFTDVDAGDTLSFSAQGLPDGLSIDTVTGIIGGMPSNAAVGAKDVTVTAADNNGGKISDVFTITTTNTNDDPTVATLIGDRTVTQNVPLSLKLSSNFADIDLGDILTYEVTGLPAGLSLDSTTGILSGTPTALGTSSNIIITANDSNGGIVSDTFDLAVTANTAPTVASAIADQIINANSVLNFTFAANTFSNVDPGDSLTFTAQLDNGGVLPAWLSFNATTRTFSGKPTNAQAGAVNVKVIATDGVGVGVSDVFNLRVNAVVTPPVPAVTPVTPITPGTSGTPGIPITPTKGVGDDATIRGTEGRDRLTGTSKNETLIGGGGNDVLKGGSGNDKLFGGAGNDQLFGGKGKDIFVLEKGKGFDIIKDFGDSLDHLAVPGVKLKKLGISQKGRDTVVSFGRDELAVLVGIQSNQITPKDFIKV